MEMMGGEEDNERESVVLKKSTKEEAKKPI
jgi:hypothetical protein